MAREGRQAELAVEALERVLQTGDEADVVSPGFLVDSVTGSPREFDVLVCRAGRFRGVEVRDRSSVVEVGEIEALVTKAADVALDEAVCISTRGFGGPARIKAEYYGIACYVLTVADKGFFGTAPTMSFYGVIPVKDGSTTVSFVVGPEHLAGDDRKWGERPVNKQGQPIDVGVFARHALAILTDPAGGKRLPHGSHEVEVRFSTSEIFAQSDLGERQPITEVVVRMPVEVQDVEHQAKVYGLYEAAALDAPPIVELSVCPVAVPGFGHVIQRLGVGSRAGGALLLVGMRTPDEG